MGGKAMASQMEAAHVPLDLSRGLLVGWHFGGVAMFAFGIIAVTVFAKRLRGESVSALPAVVIGLAYLGFGIWALAISGLNPFYIIFIVPALMLLAGSSGRTSQ
jgi:uncharacterized membrane protein YhaH (DUF805 family)